MIDEPRSPGAEITGGMDGHEMNGGGMRAPAPKLPLLRQDRPSAGVVTPSWRDSNRHGGFRGTRVASQVFTEARDKDVIPDRRDVPWSPDNVLIDTVARLHRDFNDTRAESRYLRTPGVPNVAPTPRHGTFTSTKVPRFACTTSWEQYWQVLDAIVLSNGWDDATAALQLLSHLEGDALNVALLVPAPGERHEWDWWMRWPHIMARRADWRITGNSLRKLPGRLGRTRQYSQ